MELLEFRPEESYGEKVLAVCCAARRQLRILSDDLDRAVYERPDLVDAVSKLARQRDSEVRILLRHVKPVVEEHHDLLALGRRLPSSIGFRVLADDQGLDLGFMVVADGSAVTHWPEPEIDRAYSSMNFQPRARDLVERFDRLWGRARRDRRLRELNL